MLTALGIYAIAFTTFAIGVFIASYFDFHLTISVKEKYDERIAELDKLIAINKATQENVVYKKEDLFPPELPRDYGIPRDIGE